ncbi:uncharacterized protein LOC9655833 [Selaginella moellendorffii]|nr:uncharacterized protein LOC9655833 [Selaginella moellendorffii]|eukprot:XP_002960331.2 uncharacterized protein LOC9655833 [Selaginella moellendorffii]
MGVRAAAAWSAVQGLGSSDIKLGFTDFRQERAAYAPERVSMLQGRSRHTRVGSKNDVVVGRRNGLRERRIELEQDVAGLRRKLIQEENVHKALQRAFNRPIGAIPRVPQYLPAKTRKLLAEVAVLEEEVVRLEDRVLCLQQDLTDEAVYTSMFSAQQKADAAASLRKAKLFSAGDKRAAAGKKDVLIAQLLPSVRKDDQQHQQQKQQQEVATESVKKKGLQVQKASIANEVSNPDQAAARNLHKSQLLNSNGFVKGVREKYFGIGPNVKLSVIQEEEREKENLQQQQLKKANQDVETVTFSREETDKELLPASTTAKTELHTSFKAPTVSAKPPTPTASAEKSKLSGPNRVSEELVKCLMGIYGMMTRLYSLSDSDASSVISRSTFSSFSSQTKSSSSSSYTTAKNASDFSLELDRDPYGVCCQGCQSRDVGPYRHFQNIGADSFDYSRIPNSASLFRRLRVLIGKLAGVDLQHMTRQQKLAFWINVYNACMMHAFLEYGIPCGPHQVVGLMRKATLNVGGYTLNALAIEHFILRLPSHSKQAFVKLTSKDKAHIQNNLGLEWPEPLVCFALCCGSKSSPAVRVYTAGDVENELEAAKKEYLQAAVGVSQSKGKVLIPKLLDWNLRVFAKDRESLVEWICDQLPGDLQRELQRCIGRCSPSPPLQVMPYDFNFRYLLTA